MNLDDQPDWYLQDWAAYTGHRQVDLVTELGLQKNSAHRIWHGKQPYRRDLVNLVASWLKIEPYELLMPPAEAVALRRLRETAHLIAAEDRRDWLPAQAGQPAARSRGG